MTGRAMISESIMGYPITLESLTSLIDVMHGWIENGEKGKYLVCANPHSLVSAECDAGFREALIDADIIVPDGAGMLLASRMLGGSIRQRITGSDIFYNLCAVLNEEGGRSCFFLGSTEDNLVRIATKIQSDYPTLQVAGSYSPPFKSVFDEDDNKRMINAINSVSADVLWVGMTAPKQEKWIFENRRRLNVGVIVAVGAVFDFYVGNVKRSHPVFQRLGLEWLPRLIQEPRRLWRRTFISAPWFLMNVMKQRYNK